MMLVRNQHILGTLLNLIKINFKTKKMRNQILIQNKIKSFNEIITVSSDKSLSIRWALLASQAIGKSRAYNLLDSEDVLSTLKCLQKLGVHVSLKKNYCEITGVGLNGFKFKKDLLLNAGNSGGGVNGSGGDSDCDGGGAVGGGGGGGGVRILILSRLITIPRHRDVLVHHRLLQQPQRLRVWRHFAPASDFTRDGAKAHAICL